MQRKHTWRPRQMYCCLCSLALLSSCVAEAPGVSFVYVSRWSIPSDWPRSEPPIPTDETFIPKGTMRVDEMLLRDVVMLIRWCLLIVDPECEVCDTKIVWLTQYWIDMNWHFCFLPVDLMMVPWICHFACETVKLQPKAVMSSWICRQRNWACCE